MAIPPEVRTKFYALRALAVILLVLPGVVFILRLPGFWLHLLALLAIFVSVSIVRQSNVSVRRAQGQIMPNASFEGSFAKEADRPGALAGALTAVSLVACGVCVFLVHLDALHGGEETWPVYALFVAILALILSVGYVLMTKFRKWS